MTAGVDESALQRLTPEVIGVLVRRGADFASAEDAVQDALRRALQTWPADPPRDTKGWLVTAAWHKYLGLIRSERARQDREVAVDLEPPPGPVPGRDDTLRLYFHCAHTSLSPASAAALTLRAVGGLTTRQIAAAYLVPEATTARAGGRRSAGAPPPRTTPPRCPHRQAGRLVPLAARIAPAGTPP